MRKSSLFLPSVSSLRSLRSCDISRPQVSGGRTAGQMRADEEVMRESRKCRYLPQLSRCAVGTYAASAERSGNAEKSFLV